MNRAVYKFNDVADRYVAKPVARTYDTLVPEFIRTGVRNSSTTWTTCSSSPMTCFKAR
ncbi:MAG: VacJ family lipoprotein [Betaproteobacteria bacterium]|nr:VacJ family lipoprotein [Betaproteobacteria bacterium]